MMLNNDNLEPYMEDDPNKDDLLQPSEEIEADDSYTDGLKPSIPQVDSTISTPKELDDQEEILEESVLSSVDLTEEKNLPEMEGISKEAKTESKVGRTFRKGIRWITGSLILFGLGLLTGIFMLYRPAIREAEINANQLKADLVISNKTLFELEERVVDLETEISRLQAMKDKNDELLAEQQALNLYIAILDARIDVANAQLALKEEDKTQVRIILNQTSNTLITIYELLEPEKQDVVNDFKQRLELVMEGLDDDLYSAQSDLDVLDFQLLQLQDSLFGD